jgi:hypothetical protein
MKSSLAMGLAAALACALAAGCMPGERTARRSTTTVNVDPRPPDDTNVILPPDPVSASVPRRDR